MQSSICSLILAAILLMHAGVAHAGAYANRLASCAVNASSEQDRVLMAKWYFSMMTLNKDLKDLSKFNDADRQQLNEGVKKIMERILKDTCKEQMDDALAIEGRSVMQYVGEMMGWSAMRTIMSDPSVQSEMKKQSQQLDQMIPNPDIASPTGKTP